MQTRYGRQTQLTKEIQNLNGEISQLRGVDPTSLELDEAVTHERQLNTRLFQHTSKKKDLAELQAKGEKINPETDFKGKALTSYKKMRLSKGKIATSGLGSCATMEEVGLWTATGRPRADGVPARSGACLPVLKQVMFDLAKSCKGFDKCRDDDTEQEPVVEETTPRKNVEGSRYNRVNDIARGRYINND